MIAQIKDSVLKDGAFRPNEYLSVHDTDQSFILMEINISRKSNGWLKQSPHEMIEEFKRRDFLDKEVK